MSLKIVAVGVIAAAGLGLALGGQMRPSLALKGGPPEPIQLGEGAAGPADLTPPYVTPASLQVWRDAEQVSAPAADGLDSQVRRELAQSEADLRASAAALKDYAQGVALAASAASAAAAQDAAGSYALRSEGERDGCPAPPSAPAADGDSRWSQD